MHHGLNVQEEAGINAPLEHCGVLFFVVDGADAAFHIDVYRANEYTGTVTECVLLLTSSHRFSS